MSAKAKLPQPGPAPPGVALLTYAEAAYELRCSAATVGRVVAEGLLAFRQIRRGLRLIHRDDLEAYIRSSRKRTQGETPAPEPASPSTTLRAAGWSGDDHGVKRRKSAAASPRAASRPRQDA